jgi:hypothetical protein
MMKLSTEEQLMEQCKALDKEFEAIKDANGGDSSFLSD